jgi:Histidine kinase-, DNA gyrase B-, and HSP90-like ATPase
MDDDELKPTGASADTEPSEQNIHDDSIHSYPEQDQQPDAVEQAKNHVALIRRNKGLDLLEDHESSANVEDLEKALDVLSDQLYSQPTHFLLEFIQNADDNSYYDVTPTISFTNANGHLRIDCNEAGFAPTNVEAICRIGKSTKKDRSKGFIGEKGIGFKSVFKIADVVWISSQAYSFKFDRNAQLGMIAPIWETFPGEMKADNSQFYLQLSKEKESQAEKDLLKQLRLFDSTLLLFLRKLKKIEIFINDRDWKKRFTNYITRSDTHAHGGELITIKKKWVKTKKADETLQYFVVRHITSDMPIEPKRRAMETSEVVLAFPFIENKPAFHLQKAYAFLPVRDSGFRVSSFSYPILLNR